MGRRTDQKGFVRQVKEAKARRGAAGVGLDEVKHYCDGGVRVAERGRLEEGGGPRRELMGHSS